ncbi:response regulator transcription factor [Winogradskyella echinorum]|uniref:Response regulator transcription factor n=1 Tax=Winogradskyella echinorum TaxID=538189 RepID=A0ABR6Y2X0_9FLAO|nr:LytTR family DNA-binding domain-containing protein [Winogradskyella echinorum]MBC3847091.1 response regulator transcription factor [Winogradskyella echinorum]MBC5751439.1 response regulator transcription factor [Winogradskyella echinorum]
MKPNKYITCLIIDDEPSSQKVLQHFIKETDVLFLKETCNNAAEAFKYLQLNNAIDLLFLDINMPQQSGLDFYKSLKNPPKVIFTTAYSQYAVDGFEVNAIDYLLKTISYERFLTAIHKILNSTDTSNTNNFTILKENKTLHKVFFKDIQYIEAFGDYVKVHTEEKTITTHSTFSGFIENLPDNFLRIHKSFSINLNKMNHLSGNQITVDSHTIPIGQTYKKTVLKALNL